MADKIEVVVLSAVRSAVGTFNGSLAGMEPADLGGLVIKEAIARSGVGPKAVAPAKKPTVAPYSGAMFAMVARSGSNMVERPGP